MPHKSRTALSAQPVRMPSPECRRPNAVTRCRRPNAVTRCRRPNAVAEGALEMYSADEALLLKQCSDLVVGAVLPSRLATVSFWHPCDCEEDGTVAVCPPSQMALQLATLRPRTALRMPSGQLFLQPQQISSLNVVSPLPAGDKELMNCWLVGGHENRSQCVRASARVTRGRERAPADLCSSNTNQHAFGEEAAAFLF
uniref:Uncharacterized protein n=1 Tax=Globodera rostochiensis TaxID=31243 RepID=A0A914GVQ8_GLORO